MRKTYISPTTQCVGMKIENFLCYSKHNEEASQLTNQKDFEYTGGWNSENWTAEE